MMSVREPVVQRVGFPFAELKDWACSFGMAVGKVAAVPNNVHKNSEETSSLQVHYIPLLM